MLKIKVLYFAVVRERLGLSQDEFELPPGSTLNTLWEALCQRHESLEALRPYLRAALNQDFADDDAPLHDGDEVALIPPVAGGAPRCALQTEPLDTRAIESMVERPEAGALVTFRGIVRNHAKGRAVEYLEYEIYPDMALAKLEQVADEVEARWTDSRVAMVHRYGRLYVGDDAIVIAVSSPHRAEAFEACRHAIERIKEVVPVWKKEVGPDGASWVGFGS